MFNDIHVRLVIELIQRVELSSPRKFRTINNKYSWDLIFSLPPMQTHLLPPASTQKILIVMRTQAPPSSQQVWGKVPRTPRASLTNGGENSGSHGELINSCILAPILADSDIRPMKRS